MFVDHSLRTVTSLNPDRNSSTERYKIHSFLILDQTEKRSVSAALHQQKLETWRVCWETVISGIYEYPEYAPFLERTAPEKNPVRMMHPEIEKNAPGMANFVISLGIRTSTTDSGWSEWSEMVINTGDSLGTKMQAEWIQRHDFPERFQPAVDFNRFNLPATLGDLELEHGLKTSKKILGIDELMKEYLASECVRTALVKCAGILANNRRAQNKAYYKPKLEVFRYA